MPGKKAEDGPEVGQLREAWKIPGILWESQSGVELRAKRNKPHSHFCLFLGRVGHVDNGSFCVCVHCGEQEKEELEQGWERCHRCSRHAPEGDTAGMGEGDACPTARLDTAVLSSSARTGLDPSLDPSRMQGWTSLTHQWIPSYTQLIFGCRDNSFFNFSGTRSIPGDEGRMTHVTPPLDR